MHSGCLSACTRGLVRTKPSSVKLRLSTMRAFAALIALPVIYPVFALPNPQSGVAPTSPSRTSIRFTKLTSVAVTACLHAVVASYLYTHGRTAYNSFVSPSLPSGYFAHGDADSSCTLIHTEGLKFCEDAKLWHTTGADGGVIKRVITACDPNRFTRPITHSSLHLTNSSLFTAATGTLSWQVWYPIHSNVMFSPSSTGPNEGSHWQRRHLCAYLRR